MSVEAAERLQRAIEASARSCGRREVEHIELDIGSDVTDLTYCADVEVCMSGSGHRRLVTIVTVDFINRVLVEKLWVKDDPRPDMADIYTTGGPLILVQKIDGDVIVRSVMRYLELEKHRERPGFLLALWKWACGFFRDF